MLHGGFARARVCTQALRVSNTIYITLCINRRQLECSTAGLHAPVCAHRPSEFQTLYNPMHSQAAVGVLHGGFARARVCTQALRVICRFRS
jgi:ribosomal protein L28